MVGYAIRVIKFPQHLYVVNESSIHTFYREVCRGLLRGHTYLQQVRKRACRPFNSSYDGFRL